MIVDLVPAGLVHCPLLSAMHKTCFAEPWSAESMASAFGIPGTGGLIAVCGGSMVPSLGGDGPAGFVLWRAIAGEAEILTIGVLPPWRRAGIGGRLLDGAIDRARSDKAETMFLEAAAGNAAALALYAARGFVTMGVRKAYYGAEDAVTMRCEL